MVVNLRSLGPSGVMGGPWFVALESHWRGHPSPVPPGKHLATLYYFHSLPENSCRKCSRAGGQLWTVLTPGPSCLVTLSRPDVHAGLELTASAWSVHKFPPQSAPR